MAPGHPAFRRGVLGQISADSQRGGPQLFVQQPAPRSGADFRDVAKFEKASKDKDCKDFEFVSGERYRLRVSAVVIWHTLGLQRIGTGQPVETSGGPPRECRPLG